MLDKTYQPAEIEARIYTQWEQSGVFSAGRADRVDAETYTIVIPPPNVTGSLHMGHALNNTLQDVLCRFERMRGRDVLWQPGMDHAGIATQMVVVRQLAEKQIDYRDLGREKFIEEVWAWKAKSGGAIVNQLKRLGASCDWSRERFTMDDGLSEAVLKVFVDLYNDGLIYKDRRLVNWDPAFESAVSDLEVESRDHTGKYKWSLEDVDDEDQPVAFDTAALNKILNRDPSGHMYYLRYPLADTTYDADDPETYLVVGTTRPETMLGDTGVAIHPDNEKLGAFIGKQVALPLTDRHIPVVGDTYADPEKGTGAVKITPAHDFNDWDVGKRTGLDVINILDSKGRLNDDVPEAYQGLDRFEARKAVVADLAAAGLLEKIEPHTHAVPHAQRGDAIIEPWLTSQWYVDAQTLAKPAMEAVRQGKTKFHPEKYAADYFRWLENIQPWCISRQLWWGHQIPAWYGPDDTIFVAHDEAAAQKAAAEHYGKPVELRRDEDVLDTWFSSGLWAFSTLGWPNETPDLVKRHYPTTCLVTAFDIIFFWVARMMMQSLHFMDDVPFRDVYIHGLVRDEKGQKMSKSLGNTVAPQDVIGKMGADILRLWVASSDYTDDLRIGPEILKTFVETYRKLRNSLRWMVGALHHYDETADHSAKLATAHGELPLLERFMLHRLAELDGEIRQAYGAYEYRRVVSALSSFMNADLSSFYFDVRKDALYCEPYSSEKRLAALTVISEIFDRCAIWLAPVLCFTAEEAWLYRHPSEDGSVHLQALPEQKPEWLDPALADKFDKVLRVRRVVTGALEIERREKRIGSSLEASPEIHIEDAVLLDAFEGLDVAEILITSGAELKAGKAPENAFTMPDITGIGVVPVLAQGKKCARSWRIAQDIGTDPDFPDLSARDAAAVKEFDARATGTQH